MTDLLRRFANLLTFGLVRHLDEEIGTQHENVKRVKARQPRINRVEELWLPRLREGRKR